MCPAVGCVPGNVYFSVIRRSKKKVKNKTCLQINLNIALAKDIARFKKYFFILLQPNAKPEILDHSPEHGSDGLGWQWGDGRAGYTAEATATPAAASSNTEWLLAHTECLLWVTCCSLSCHLPF